MTDATMGVLGNARTNKRAKADQYDLRDMLLELPEMREGVAFSGGTFRLYRDGVWQAVDDYQIRQLVSRRLSDLSDQYEFPRSRSTETDVTDLLRSAKYTRETGWNTHPEILVFRNCALVTSGDMHTADHSPEHMATVGLPYDYDGNACAPTWDYVVQDLLDQGGRDFLQEWFGYCLTTSTKHQITLWLVGPRGGGRSTIIRGAETMLGGTSGLAGSLGLTQLQGGGARFALANIPGKTLLTCTENPRQHIKATDTLNALITGDTIQVEKKFKRLV